MKDDNDIRQLDCCVNTNALILLNVLRAETGVVAPAYLRIIKMLNQAVQWNGDSYDRLSMLTPYYAHPHEWRVALEYARQRGIPQLAPVMFRERRARDRHFRLPMAQTAGCAETA